MSQPAVPSQPLDEPVPRVAALSHESTRAVFGQTMGLVAVTVGTAALGAYLGRNLGGGVGIALFVGALACVVGLNVATERHHEQTAIGLLFGLGLLIGMAVAPVLATYARTQPQALWQAAGTTAAFVAAFGTYGYATRRDLSPWVRTLYWALLALIVFGIVGLFLKIPDGNAVYCVLGLAIFGGFTIFDFNRLRSADTASAVPIAAGIFLDIFNVFLLLLDFFGGGWN